MSSFEHRQLMSHTCSVGAAYVAFLSGIIFVDLIDWSSVNLLNN